MRSCIVDDKGLISPLRAPRQTRGKLKVKEEPTMLLKTHIEKMSLLREPIMLMITKTLSNGTHYVSQNKGVTSNPPPKTGSGEYAKEAAKVPASVKSTVRQKARRATPGLFFIKGPRPSRVACRRGRAGTRPAPTACDGRCTLESGTVRTAAAHPGVSGDSGSPHGLHRPPLQWAGRTLVGPTGPSKDFTREEDGPIHAFTSAAISARAWSISSSVL